MLAKRGFLNLSRMKNKKVVGGEYNAVATMGTRVT